LKKEAKNQGKKLRNHIFSKNLENDPKIQKVV
jgi:hypothetical protein